MNATKTLLVLSIIALVVLAGCSSSAEKSYAPSSSGQKYVGGGCGVGAPADSSDVAQNLAVTKTADAL